LRGDTYNESRKAVVDEALKKFDRDGCGQATLCELKGSYDPTATLRTKT